MSDKYTIKFDANSKFYDLPAANFEPLHLYRLKESNLTGYYQEVFSLFAAMYENWPSLRKDVDTMADAVAGLEYKAVPVTQDGKQPTAQAIEAARVVNDALWKKSEQVPGEWAQNFTQALKSIYWGKLRGVSVTEVYWNLEDGLVFPQKYRPVLPQFFAWAIQNGEPDRLLLYPEGNLTGEGVEIPRDKFLVSMNTDSPDHPMFNAVLQSLVVAFCGYKWGWTWLAQYANIFGRPIRVFNVDSAADKAKLEKELASKPVLTDVVFVGEKDRVTVTPAGAGGAGLPQKELAEMAERECHKLILGNTLTSDTSDNGGSLAQAKVHMGVQENAVLAHGEFVCTVLNAQFVPAIIRKNYGNTHGVPLPEIRCSVPNVAKNAAKVEYYKGLSELGVPLKLDAVMDDFGQAMPKAGELVIQAGQAVKYKEPGDEPAPAPEKQQEGKEDDRKTAAEQYMDDADTEPEDMAQAAKAGETDWQDMELDDLVSQVYGTWTAPTLDALGKALNEGAGPDEVARLIKEGKLRPDTDAVAGLLRDITLDTLKGGRE